MKLRKKKLKLKQSQRIKTIVLTTGLLICCCIVIALLLLINSFTTTIYKVDSRVGNITKEKKIDKTENGYSTIAWLKVQGTNIDAPIIGYDQITALANVDKEDYLWNRINLEKKFNQVSISGHNILNLSKKPQVGKEYFSRFDDLMAFVYKDFIEENKYIQYTIDNEDYVYKIFGVFFERDYKLDLRHEGDYTKKETKAYLKQIADLNIYDFDIDVNENDSLITLTTCTRMFGTNDKRQLVVVGRQLRKNEKMANYDVKPNKNYKEVENIVGGDESNEKV